MPPSADTRSTICAGRIRVERGVLRAWCHAEIASRRRWTSAVHAARSDRVGPVALGESPRRLVAAVVPRPPRNAHLVLLPATAADGSLSLDPQMNRVGERRVNEESAS